MNRRERGSVAIWMLIYLLALSGLVAWVALGQGGAGAIASAVGSTALTLGLIVVLARVDLHRCCMGLVPFSAIVGVFACGAMVLSEVPSVTTIVICSSAWLAFFAASAFLIVTLLRPSSIPNVLASRWSKSEIYESDGVQFACGLVAGSEPYEAAVMLEAQNSWDRERTLLVYLAAKQGRGSKLTFQSTATLVLAASETARIYVPIMNATSYPTTDSIAVAARTKGSGGRRLAYWHAKSAPTRIPEWLTLVLAPFGLFVWGGGLWIDVRLGGNPDPTPRTAAPQPIAERMGLHPSTAPHRSTGVRVVDATRVNMQQW